MAGRSITLARFNALRLGTPEAVIRQKLGLPERRQNVVQYGFTHEEPRGQRCVYYRRRFPDAGDPWNRSDTFELCFAGSRLRYKWAYLAARA